MIFYDIEVFKHDWIVVCINPDNETIDTFINDYEGIQKYYESNSGDIWAGYNSRHYDQYILKGLLLDMDPKPINDHIIVEGGQGWQYSRAFQKIRLYNYDVMTARDKGLKQLEGFMGHNIKETSVPFDIDRRLTPQELQEAAEYCRHDVEETIEVFIQTIEEYESHIALLKAFEMPIPNVSKSKAQLSAMILDAKQPRTPRNDEFNITIPENIKIKKYKHIVDWYRNPLNRDYDKELKVDVAGCEHIFAWGGIHGAIKKYSGDGIYLNCDVASLYPAIMIEYGFLSRNVQDPEKYVQIRDTRLKLKAAKDPKQLPYKIVLNSTYGAMKDKYNPLYDPLQANNVCVTGQLLLLDLIEQVEPYCQLIQSNTDGIFIKVDNMTQAAKVKEIAAEWEKRTRLDLEWETFTRIYQKDVNNYIIFDADGKAKSKGAYVKKLNPLDNDLPIVNAAVKAYFAKGTHPEKTVGDCTDLLQFQKIVKVSSKFQYGTHGGQRLNERVLRVFASRSRSDGGVFKIKEGKPQKIGNTPEKCFIENGNIEGQQIPRKLDKSFYVEMALKRIRDFGVRI